MLRPSPDRLLCLKARAPCALRFIPLADLISAFLAVDDAFIEYFGYCGRTMTPLSLKFFFLLALGCPFLAQADTTRSTAAPSADRQRELLHLVRQDCGSCHGLTLLGGLGPSLRPESLRDKPLESLVASIYRGRPGTPMPPWERFISEQEARWLVEQLLAGRVGTR